MDYFLISSRRYSMGLPMHCRLNLGCQSDKFFKAEFGLEKFQSGHYRSGLIITNMQFSSLEPITEMICRVEFKRIL